MKKKRAIWIILGSFILLVLFVYKTNYNTIIKDYPDEVKAFFPKEIPSNVKNVKLSEGSMLESPRLYLQLYFDKKEYRKWCTRLGVEHRIVAKCKITDKKVRNAEEYGAYIVKNNYYIPTGFLGEFEIPKSKTSWKYNFVINQNEDKEEKWNHGVVSGWTENDELRCIIFFYEDW